MKKTILLILFLVLIPLSSSAATYTKYVKSAGNDEAVGDADGTAWATAERVNTFLDTLGSGDVATIYFNKGDTWASDETLCQNSGAAIDFPDCTITFDAYGTGANPLFNTETMSLLHLDDVNAVDITIKDLQLYGSSAGIPVPIRFDSCTGDIVIDGVDMDGRGDGTITITGESQIMYFLECETGTIEIKNCILHDWGPQTNPTYDAYKQMAIKIWSNDGDAELASVNIHDNTIYNIDGDGLHLAGLEGPVHYITGNTIYNCGENVIDQKGCDNLYISNNTFYRDNWALGSSSSSGPLIVSHKSTSGSPSGSSENVNIYNNLFAMNHDDANNTHRPAIMINKSHGAMYIYDNIFKNCSPALLFYYGTISAHNNKFINTETIQEGGGDLAFVRNPSGYSPSLTFVNNSMYAHTGSGTLYGIRQEGNATGTYENNIFYLTANNAYGIHTGAYSPTVDYNIYYGTDTERIYYGGTAYTTSNFATYGVISGHTNEINDNPDFTSPATGDLTLQAGSPGIGSGDDVGDTYKNGWSVLTSDPPTTVTTIDRDVVGWDIGLYVFDNTPATISNNAPSGSQAYTTTIQLSFNTDEAANARYSTVNEAYGDMGDTCTTTDGTYHAVTVSVSEGSNTFYVACVDPYGNITAQEAITFTVLTGDPPDPGPEVSGVVHGGMVTSGGAGL